MLLSGMAAIAAGFLDDGSLKLTLAVIGKFGATSYLQLCICIQLNYTQLKFEVLLLACAP